MKDKRYLVETSAVLPALGYSSRPHNQHFADQVEGGSLVTSSYVRMETLRRWVCEIIEYAQMVEMSSSVSDAASFWKEAYGRKPKLQGFLDTALYRSGVKIEDANTHGAATEIAQIALDLIELFDLRLKGRTTNTCGCQIGGMAVEVDGNDLLGTLSAFRSEFQKNVTDCPVNKFLQFRNPKGRSARIVGCEHLDRDQDARAVRQPLKELYEAQKHVTCRECGRIGDQIIAMEHPTAFNLIHIDKSYDHLCKCTGHNHTRIQSNASFKPKAPAPQDKSPTAG